MDTVRELQKLNNSTSGKHIVSAFIKLVVILNLIHCKLNYASVIECNYDRYGTGCPSQTNLECDLDTYTCKCSLYFPVLIESRFCVEKAKTNDLCHYNEQCDIAKGFYCCFNDYKLINVSLSEGTSRNYESSPRCRLVTKEIIAAQLNSNNHNRPNSKSSNHNINSSKQQTYNHSTSRLVWIFLIACLIGIFILFVLVKSQCYRIAHRRSISVDNDADVPPPYEVAIRMKV